MLASGAVLVPDELMTSQGFGDYIKKEYEQAREAAKLAGLTPSRRKMPPRERRAGSTGTRYKRPKCRILPSWRTVARMTGVRTQLTLQKPTL